MKSATGMETSARGLSDGKCYRPPQLEFGNKRRTDMKSVHREEMLKPQSALYDG